jgi:ferredoxin-type protein NapG
MMNEMNPSQPREPRPDRRQFFLHGLGKTLEGLLGAVEKASPIPLAAVLADSRRRVLRPPGALSETEFLKTCYRCGSCMDACKPRAIKVLQDNDEEMSGTPYLDPDLQACELCSDVPCVHACPSGALRNAHKDASECPGTD